jgi:hypothetical protein
MEKKQIYATQVQTGTRTFFFDIKEADNGKPYLVITESKKSGDQYERKNMVLFESDIEKFSQGFLKTLLNFTPQDREEMIREARKKYPNAFEPWTEEDEKTLTERFRAGRSFEEIASEFGRNENAIRKRLEKLGLIEKKTKEKASA